MSLKRKEILTRQKEYLEQKLKDRKTLLTGKGLDAVKADRDPISRNLQASIKAVAGRLRAVAASEKLTEDLKKMRADRAAAALKEKEAAQTEKPKKEKAPQEAKPKKEKGEKPEKGEKKPAGPKPQEGGKEAAEPKAPKTPKAPKPAETPEEPKA